MAMRRQLMKQMNINKMMNMMPRRRRRRNTMLLSLLGLGIAGGATAAYTMRKGKGKEKVKHLFRNLTSKADNIDINNILKPTLSK
jgi:hypothetical protein